MGRTERISDNDTLQARGHDFDTLACGTGDTLRGRYWRGVNLTSLESVSDSRVLHFAPQYFPPLKVPSIPSFRI